MFRKIAVKTVLLFLLISIVPISILSYISLQKAQDALKKSIMNSFANLAEEKAQAIRHHLEDHQFEAQALASRPEVKEAVRQANLSYPGLENILRLDREWISAQGHSPEADRIMAAPLSGFLEEYQDSDPESYGEIFVTDANGATVAMTRVLSDYYQADEAWWISGYGEGKGMSLFDDRGHDQSVGAPVIGVVVPVRDKGNVIGILKINYTVKGVLEIVERTRIGGSDLVFLARSSGTIAAMSKQRNYELTDLEKGLLKEIKPGVTEDSHNGKKTIMAYAHVETQILTRVRQSAQVEGTSGEKWEPGKWTLFIEMDQDEAFLPIFKLRQTIRISLLLAIAIVVLLALFISSRITSPLRELITGVKILGEGDLSHHVQVKAKDEIGELAGAFNKMAANLKTVMASREELEKEVAERKSLEHDLWERVKELRCNYGVSSLLHRQDLALDALLHEIVRLVPSGWQYPEITHARITFGGKEFTGHGFKESPWKLAADILVHGQKAGCIEVFYGKEKKDEYEGPFLKEERSLLDNIAVEIGAVMEHRGAEEELRKSEERYRTMIEAMSNCVAVYKAVEDGKDFVFLEFNRAAEITDKAKAEEVIGKKVTEAFPGVREFGLLDVFQRVYRTGKAEHFPAAFYQDSRVEGWRDNFVYKLPSGEVVAVYEDVTELKKAEESERLNMEKVAHLDRLKSLGTLASGIGHEINNPNNFILMNTTLLREIWDDARNILVSSIEKNPGEVKLGGLPFDKALETFPQLIEDVRQGSVRIKEIVSNLRDFAVTGQLSPRESVNLMDVIQSAESLTRNLVQKSTRRFALDIGDLPAVRGNFQRLEQVMVNLVTNACHSLTDPGQAVEIKAFSGMEKGMVYVIVRDEGMGMDQETLKRVVEPFFTTKQHLGGAGLGASISHGIIKEHGGTMEYASEPGKGTTVTVALPAA